MSKRDMQRDEYEISSEEFHIQKSDYNPNTNEFNITSDNFTQREFGSQPQSEFNEHQEQVQSKPKKSKFKKMMQYLVAGVAGAAIIVSSAGSVKHNQDVESEFPSVQDSELEIDSMVENDIALDNEMNTENRDIICDIPYNTYAYTLESGKVYIVGIDEANMDEFYYYLSGLAFYLVDSFDTLEEYEDFCSKGGEIRVKHNFGGSNSLEHEGKISYDYIAYGTDLVGHWISINFTDDIGINSVETVFSRYEGMSREQIYNEMKENSAGNIQASDSYIYTNTGRVIDLNDDYHSELISNAVISGENVDILMDGEEAVYTGSIWDMREKEDLEIIIPAFLKVDIIE